MLDITDSKIQKNNNEFIEARKEIEKRDNEINIIENRMNKLIEKNIILEDLSHCRGENVKIKNEKTRAQAKNQYTSANLSKN